MALWLVEDPSMTIHYHGTPITPNESLLRLAGSHFCVSFWRPDQLKTCLDIGQSVMLDNGAFSAWRQNVQLKWTDYYAWIEPILAPPHWAVIPDMIDGDPSENTRLVLDWRFPRSLGAPVWHTNETLGQLHWMLDRGFGKICIGSTREHPPGSDPWRRKLEMVFNDLAQSPGPLPWVHMLRGIGQINRDGFPFASADSTNIAQNHKRNGQLVNMVRRLDSIQAPMRWLPQPEQIEAF